MTEKKRFSLRYIDEEHISANIYDNETFIASISIGEELLVKVLNQLVEENEQLKQENDWLHESVNEATNFIYDNFEVNRMFTDRELNDICNDMGWELSEKSIKLQQLEKENEQLKKQLQKGEDVCSICNHQYLTKRDTDEYYIAKCKKEHIECSKGTVNYCEDFECKEITE